MYHPRTERVTSMAPMHHSLSTKSVTIRLRIVYIRAIHALLVYPRHSGTSTIPPSSSASSHVLRWYTIATDTWHTTSCSYPTGVLASTSEPDRVRIQYDDTKDAISQLIWPDSFTSHTNDVQLIIDEHYGGSDDNEDSGNASGMVYVRGSHHNMWQLPLSSLIAVYHDGRARVTYDQWRFISRCQQLVLPDVHVVH